MFKGVGLAALLAVSVQAQAAYECQVTLKDDIIVTSSQVQVIGSSGNLVIAPDGSVSRNGTALALSEATRNQSRSYQESVRQALPVIYDDAHRKLSEAQSALDNVIVEHLGSGSKVRQRLVTLKDKLSQQMETVLEKKDNGEMVFNHQAIANVEQNSRSIIESTLGGVVQDSINEMGSKADILSGKNPLQSVMGNLGGLQDSIRKEWKTQQADFDNYVKNACETVKSLEKQRATLVNALPK